jgi:hypothetical protein
MDTLMSPLLRTRTGSLPESSVTNAEISALVTLARSRGARTIAIGSGRDPRVLDAVRPLADAWELAEGEVTLELTWPETAASWLRQAKRFAAAECDLWIMLGPPLGWAQMTRRLLWSTPWKPAHAVLAVDDGLEVHQFRR